MAEVQTRLIETLSQSPHAFLTPGLPLQTDILRYVKHILDPVALEVSALQTVRHNEERRKRKRRDALQEAEPLRLKSIHVDGLAVEQVWEQTRRVIEATRRETQRALDRMRAQDDSAFHESASEEDVDVESEQAHSEDLDSDGDITKEALELDEDMDIDSDDLDDEDAVQQDRAEEFVADKFGLNDGFFSIDNFNKQSEFLEQQDARGDNDGAASDEEDVDWDADPLSAANTVQTNGKPAPQDESDDEGGPTFGDPDASGEDEAEVDEGELDGMGGLGNTNDILYADFFAPPAKKKSKKKKEPKPKAKPAQEDDIQRTMEAVQRDLFDDEDDEDMDEDDTQQLDPADPMSRRSAHERRQAALAEEIRKLENANVAKREWAMSGEARAADRPVNSLLEEDLDFERTGKPVPVITAEVSESIEELIKRRILAHDFQDILRRRPNDLATGKDSRRGQLDFTLDDTKSKKGLAEEYEEEHLRKTDANFVDVSDEKLAKEQREIEALWKDISSKLDSLSSWHFRPKAPTAQLDIRVDAPTITMEDARPNAGGDVAAASQLAPQEIYKGGEGSKGNNEEVVGKSGLPAVREELSRDDKKRRRRREKERIHKKNTNEPAKKPSTPSNDKQQMVNDLRRGNVKVIGKTGDLTDVQGNAVVSGGPGHTAAKFKL